jgi:hypothetical protein
MLHVIVQYYNDPNPERQAEIDDCFQRNLSCPWVEEIHNLVEPDTVMPEWLVEHPKYVEKRVTKRLSYAQAIDYGNQKLIGKRICLMNADTFVDAESPWFEVKKVDPKVILCQTRHELSSSGDLVMDPIYFESWGRNTQDAWIWQSPITVPNSDFELGRLGCDNAIAHRFKSAGYLVVNRGSVLKIGHIDRCRGKTAAQTCQFHSQRETRQEFRPASEGWAFVPDIQLTPPLETLLEHLKLSGLHSYVIASELISTLWDIDPEVLGKTRPIVSAESNVPLTPTSH